MRSFMKRFISGAALFAALMILFLSVGTLTARAADFTSGEFLNMAQSAKAYATKNESSKVVASLKEGDMVCVTDKDGQWIQILYQGEFLYIPGGDEMLKPLTNEAVADEFERTAQTDKAWVESYLAQEKAQRNARIWRVAIIVIIVVVLGVIVFNSIHRANKEAEAKETEETKEAEEAK